jgi:hypothetical protein
VAAYIEGYDKFDGKFNAVAMQAEERNDYWGLMVDYAPGSKVYSWALFPTARSGRPNGRMISGEDAASQMSASLLQGEALLCADRRFFQKLASLIEPSLRQSLSRFY